VYGREAGDGNGTQQFGKDRVARRLRIVEEMRRVARPIQSVDNGRQLLAPPAHTDPPGGQVEPRRLDPGQFRQGALDSADATGAMHVRHGKLDLARPVAEIAGSQQHLLVGRQAGCGDRLAAGRATTHRIAPSCTRMRKVSRHFRSSPASASIAAIHTPSPSDSPAARPPPKSGRRLTALSSASLTGRRNAMVPPCNRIGLPSASVSANRSTPSAPDSRELQPSSACSRFSRSFWLISRPATCELRTTNPVQLVLANTAMVMLTAMMTPKNDSMMSRKWRPVNCWLIMATPDFRNWLHNMPSLDWTGLQP